MARACEGFYGPGSDRRTGTPAWCRLEGWEGHRSPRLYWTLGKAYFKPFVFQQQVVGETCPFSGPHFQLMRNFLFAASFAAREGHQRFGVLAICPRRYLSNLTAQVEAFRTEILRDELRGRLELRTYEDYTETLRRSGDSDAAELATFLEGRIAMLK
jgi:hypothetical protein